MLGVMICPKCSAEQTGNFCTKCGKRLKEVEAAAYREAQEEEAEASVEAIEGVEPASADPSDPREREPSVPAAQTVFADEVHVVVDKALRKTGLLREFALPALLASTFLAALMTALSIFLDIAARTGSFVDDLLFHILKHVTGLPSERAAYYSGEMGPGYWLHLALLHGGRFQLKEFVVSSSGETLVAFSFHLHLPMLSSTAMLFAVAVPFLILISGRARLRAWKNSYKLAWLAGFSACYAAIVTGFLLLVHPSTEWTLGEESSILRVSIAYAETAANAFIAIFIAGVVGIGGKSFLGSLRLRRLLGRGVRRAVWTMVSFSGLIGLLMIATWSLSDVAGLHSSGMITIGSVWRQYRTEPAFYMILPNVLFQEFIYSLGGTWHVSGSRLANLLQAKEAFSLQWGRGITVSEGWERIGSDAPATGDGSSDLERGLRFAWFHPAFALAYAYSLSRIRPVGAAGYILLPAGLVGALALLAAYSNIRLKAPERTSEMIGFSFGEVVLSGGVATVVFLLLSFVLRKVLQGRKGDSADGR